MHLTSTVTWSLRKEGVPQGCVLPRSPRVLAKWKTICAFGHMRLHEAKEGTGTWGQQGTAVPVSGAHKDPSHPRPANCVRCLRLG